MPRPRPHERHRSVKSYRGRYEWEDRLPGPPPLRRPRLRSVVSVARPASTPSSAAVISPAKPRAESAGSQTRCRGWRTRDRNPSRIRHASRAVARTSRRWTREDVFVISLKPSLIFDRLERLSEQIEHRHAVLDGIALEFPVKGRGHLEVQWLEACWLRLIEVANRLLDWWRRPLLRAFWR